MTKINTKIAVFIAFLALVILWGLFANASADMKTPVDTKVPVDTKTPFKEKVAGFFVEFEEGTTEPEVKAILENYNMTINTIDYNSDIMPSRYYMILDRDKRMDVRNELRKDENWTDPIYFNHDIKKGNHYIITVTKQAVQDKNFIALLEKNNPQVKNSVLCLITLGDESKNWIWESDERRIENELNMNERVLTVISCGST